MKYEYHITPTLAVLCLRNVVVDGPVIHAEENRVTSWVHVTLPNWERYNSVREAYDQAIDKADHLLRSLERQKGIEIEAIQDGGEGA